MSGPHRSTIRELTGTEAQSLLTRNWIGRIAFAFHDRVDIEPIHYFCDPPWIIGRTSPGAKLLTLAHNQWCAFEVDEVRGMFDWESVVAKGPFTTFASDAEGPEFEHAVMAVRHLSPSALTDDDPTPRRNIVFRIHLNEISGRRSVPTAELETAGSLHHP